jgi:hypothetical protein
LQGAVQDAMVQHFNDSARMFNSLARHFSAPLTRLKAQGPKGAAPWVYAQLNAGALNAAAPLGDLPMLPKYNIVFPSMFWNENEELTAVRVLDKY